MDSKENISQKKKEENIQNNEAEQNKREDSFRNILGSVKKKMKEFLFGTPYPELTRSQEEIALIDTLHKGLVENDGRGEFSELYALGNNVHVTIGISVSPKQITKIPLLGVIDAINEARKKQMNIVKVILKGGDKVTFDSREHTLRIGVQTLGEEKSEEIRKKTSRDILEVLFTGKEQKEKQTEFLKNLGISIDNLYITSEHGNKPIYYWYEALSPESQYFSQGLLKLISNFPFHLRFCFNVPKEWFLNNSYALLLLNDIFLQYKDSIHKIEFSEQSSHGDDRFTKYTSRLEENGVLIIRKEDIEKIQNSNEDEKKKLQERMLDILSYERFENGFPTKKSWQDLFGKYTKTKLKSLYCVGYSPGDGKGHIDFNGFKAPVFIDFIPNKGYEVTILTHMRGDSPAGETLFILDSPEEVAKKVVEHFEPIGSSDREEILLTNALLWEKSKSSPSKLRRNQKKMLLHPEQFDREHPELNKQKKEFEENKQFLERKNLHISKQAKEDPNIVQKLCHILRFNVRFDTLSVKVSVSIEDGILHIPYLDKLLKHTATLGSNFTEDNVSQVILSTDSETTFDRSKKILRIGSQDIQVVETGSFTKELSDLANAITVGNLHNLFDVTRKKVKQYKQGIEIPVLTPTSLKLAGSLSEIIQKNTTEEISGFEEIFTLAEKVHVIIGIPTPNIKGIPRGSIDPLLKKRGEDSQIQTLVLVAGEKDIFDTEKGFLTLGTETIHTSHQKECKKKEEQEEWNQIFTNLNAPKISCDSWEKGTVIIHDENNQLAYIRLLNTEEGESRYAVNIFNVTSHKYEEIASCSTPEEAAQKVKEEFENIQNPNGKKVVDISQKKSPIEKKWEKIFQNTDSKGEKGFTIRVIEDEESSHYLVLISYSIYALENFAEIHYTNGKTQKITYTVNIFNKEKREYEEIASCSTPEEAAQKVMEKFGQGKTEEKDKKIPANPQKKQNPNFTEGENLYNEYVVFPYETTMEIIVGDTLLRVGKHKGKFYLRTPHTDILFEDNTLLSIGRKNCDIQLLGDGLISEQHLFIKREGKIITIQDANSSNGTRVQHSLKPPFYIDERSLEIQNHTGEVVAIGDSNGSYETFFWNLRHAEVIDGDGNWTAGNTIAVIQGDILGDRETQSFEILEKIAQLREQAQEQGGDVFVLAGNHEDLVFSYLTNRNGCHEDGVEGLVDKRQVSGLLEFTTFTGDKKMLSKEKSVEYAIEIGRLKRGEILENMKKDERGKKILEEMCNIKLCTRIGSTIIMHTDPTSDILWMLAYEGVESINQDFQAALRDALFHGIAIDETSNQLFDIFLDTNNRTIEKYVNKNINEYTEKDMKKEYGDDYGEIQPDAQLIGALKKQGIKTIVFGHSNVGKGNRTLNIEGVCFVNTDQGSLKNKKQTVNAAWLHKGEVRTGEEMYHPGIEEKTVNEIASFLREQGIPDPENNVVYGLITKHITLKNISKFLPQGFEIVIRGLSKGGYEIVSRGRKRAAQKVQATENIAWEVARATASEMNTTNFLQNQNICFDEGADVLSVKEQLEVMAYLETLEKEHKSIIENFTQLNSPLIFSQVSESQKRKGPVVKIISEMREKKEEDNNNCVLRKGDIPEVETKEKNREMEERKVFHIALSSKKALRDPTISTQLKALENEAETVNEEYKKLGEKISTLKMKLTSEWDEDIILTLPKVYTEGTVNALNALWDIKSGFFKPEQNWTDSSKIVITNTKAPSESEVISIDHTPKSITLYTMDSHGNPVKYIFFHQALKNCKYISIRSEATHVVDGLHLSHRERLEIFPGNGNAVIAYTITGKEQTIDGKTFAGIEKGTTILGTLDEYDSPDRVSLDYKGEYLYLSAEQANNMSLPSIAEANADITRRLKTKVQYAPNTSPFDISSSYHTVFEALSQNDMPKPKAKILLSTKKGKDMCITKAGLLQLPIQNKSETDLANDFKKVIPIWNFLTSLKNLSFEGTNSIENFLHIFSPTVKELLKNLGIHLRINIFRVNEESLRETLEALRNNSEILKSIGIEEISLDNEDIINKETLTLKGKTEEGERKNIQTRINDLLEKKKQQDYTNGYSILSDNNGKITTLVITPNHQKTKEQRKIIEDLKNQESGDMKEVLKYLSDYTLDYAQDIRILTYRNGKIEDLQFVRHTFSKTFSAAERVSLYAYFSLLDEEGILFTRGNTFKISASENGTTICLPQGENIGKHRKDIQEWFDPKIDAKTKREIFTALQREGIQRYSYYNNGIIYVKKLGEPIPNFSTSVCQKPKREGYEIDFYSGEVLGDGSAKKITITVSNSSDIAKTITNNITREINKTLSSENFLFQMKDIPIKQQLEIGKHHKKILAGISENIFSAVIIHPSETPTREIEVQIQPKGSSSSSQFQEDISLVVKLSNKQKISALTKKITEVVSDYTELKDKIDFEIKRIKKKWEKVAEQKWKNKEIIPELKIQKPYTEATYTILHALSGIEPQYLWIAPEPQREGLLTTDTPQAKQIIITEEATILDVVEDVTSGIIFHTKNKDGEAITENQIQKKLKEMFPGSIAMLESRLNISFKENDAVMYIATGEEEVLENGVRKIGNNEMKEVRIIVSAIQSYEGKLAIPLQREGNVTMLFLTPEQAKNISLISAEIINEFHYPIKYASNALPINISKSHINVQIASEKYKKVQITNVLLDPNKSTDINISGRILFLPVQGKTVEELTKMFDQSIPLWNTISSWEKVSFSGRIENLSNFLAILQIMTKEENENFFRNLTTLIIIDLSIPPEDFQKEINRIKTQ